MMSRNHFINKDIAANYDKYYTTPQGSLIDDLERTLVLKYLNKIPSSQMLELGCGTGHWTQLFADSGFSVTAVDISDAMLNIALQKDIKNATFQKEDASNLPFPENRFDFIASITMLEFVDNADLVLNEIYRLLKPGGWLLLGCLNKNSELGKVKNSDEVFRDARFFSVQELADYLIRFGQPITEQCVFFSPSFEILDNTAEKALLEGSFIVACVQKIK